MDKIIIQETDPAISDMLTQAFAAGEVEAHLVSEFDTGTLEYCRKILPALVILDFKIDGSAAKKACRLIKNKYPHLPVIAMSCNSQISVQYSKYGFDGYLEKPFDLNVLSRLIRFYLSKGNPA